jgi:hypothetical protein
MDKLFARLPERRSILGVYATAVFLAYGWTLLASFWKVPSWMFFMRISDILSVYAYSFVIDFAESLLLLGMVLLAGVLLPKRWWNAQFTSKGVLWILVLTGSMMLRLYTNRSPDRWESFVSEQGMWWGYTLLLALALSFLVSRIPLLRRGLESLADRLVAFLYIYLPLTVIAIVVVFARIVF